LGVVSVRATRWRGGLAAPEPDQPVVSLGRGGERQLAGAWPAERGVRRRTERGARSPGASGGRAGRVRRHGGGGLRLESVAAAGLGGRPGAPPQRPSPPAAAPTSTRTHLAC